MVWTEELALDGIAPSIGSVGDAYDNALMGRINGLYKAECVRTTIFHDGPFKTIADVEFATVYYESLTGEILPAQSRQRTRDGSGWIRPAHT